MTGYYWGPRQVEDHLPPEHDSAVTCEHCDLTFTPDDPDYTYSSVDGWVLSVRCPHCSHTFREYI